MLLYDVIQELAALRHDLVLQSIQQVQLGKKREKKNDENSDFLLRGKMCPEYSLSEG